MSSRLVLLRELVVEAALEVLDRDGLGLSADAVSYRSVFAHLEREHGIRVVGGSVQGRIWTSHDDYRNEVLAVAAGMSSPTEDGRRLREAMVSILQLVDDLGLGHRDRLRAFCRIAGQELFAGYIESDRFRRFQAIKGVARSTKDEVAGPRLRSMVSEIADDTKDELCSTFELVLKALRLRPRPELGLDVSQAIRVNITLVQTLITGAHLDHQAGFTAMASKVDTELAAEGDWPWTNFGFSFLAAMELLFEPDPGADNAPFDYEAALDGLASSRPSSQRPDVPSPIADQPRRSREELRELLVSAGVEVLLQDGVNLKPNSLAYSSVFAHIKATRNVTVHRSGVHKHIWGSQDEFRADVLAEAASYHTEESLNMARQAMAAQPISRHTDGSLNYRQMILDSTLAIVSAQMVVSAKSSSFRRWQSIKASMLSPDPENNFVRLRQAVDERYQDLIEAFVSNYQAVLPLVGLGVNPDLGLIEEQAYHIFAVGGAAFTSGADYNITAGATGAADTVRLPRADQTGQTDDWPIQALGSLALLDLLFVPQQ